MKAILKYWQYCTIYDGKMEVKDRIKITIVKEFEGSDIRFITGGSEYCPDFRVYVDDNVKFSVSPNHFISFEYESDN